MTRSRKVTEAKAATSFSEDELANLPCNQTWNLLTSLLYKTVLPLAKTTTFPIDLIFSLISSTSDQRRKISIYDSKKCFEISYSLLFKDAETIMKTIIFEMGVERWVIADFVNNFLAGTYNPKPIEVEEKYYFSREALVRHVRDNFEVYNEYRNRVSYRFKKLSDSQAAKNRWQKEQFGLTSEQGDNENNFFLSVLRAIDKLYPEKGTLTNYVQLWLSNSPGSHFTLFTGEAFNLSRPVRQRIADKSLVVNNKAYDLDKATNIPAPEAQSLMKEENNSILDVIASVQRIPSLSLSMLLHGFDIVPTPILVDQLQKQFDKEGIQEEVKVVYPDLEELPTILPLSRSSRKDTEHQRRRKEILRSKKAV